MGQGKLTGWLGRIRPFYDRLDIEIEVVWYGVPSTNPVGPVTVFTDRFYDDLDGWTNLGVGTVSKSMVPYFGAVPTPAVLPQIGSDADFVKGISYEDYLHGAVGTRCFVVDPPTHAVRLREVEYFEVFGAVHPTALHGGLLLGGSDAPVSAPTVTTSGGLLLGGSDDFYNRGCVNCPGGSRFYGSLTCVGALDGTEPALLLNDTFQLGYVSGCTYQSANFVPYAGAPACRWQVVIQPTGCQISLRRVTGSGLPAFILPNVPAAGCLTDAVQNPTSEGAPIWDLSASTFTWHPQI